MNAGKPSHVSVAKEIALKFLANEREKIMRMSHDEALRELVKVHRLRGQNKGDNIGFRQ